MNLECISQIVPNTGPYARELVEDLRNNPAEKFADDDSTILMVAEDEQGVSLGTYAIKDPADDIRDYLDFMNRELVDRFDLAGSIQLVLR